MKMEITTDKLKITALLLSACMLSGCGEEIAGTYTCASVSFHGHEEEDRDVTLVLNEDKTGTLTYEDEEQDIAWTLHGSVLTITGTKSYTGMVKDDRITLQMGKYDYVLEQED